MSKIMEDNRKRFENAFEMYSDELYRHCFFRINDRERAEEIVQQAFMKSWQMVVNGKNIENLRAYLYRTVHNLVLNEYRGRKHNVSLEELSESTGIEPAAEVEENPDLGIIEARKFIDLLEPHYKVVMIMRYVDDLPIKEIARILNESETGISVKIHRAIKKLQKIIEEEKT